MVLSCEIRLLSCIRDEQIVRHESMFALQSALLLSPVYPLPGPYVLAFFDGLRGAAKYGPEIVEIIKSRPFLGLI